MTTIELISLIAAMGAVGAAIAAWRAAYEANKNLKAQLVINITDAYAAPEMLNAMKELREFERKYHNQRPIGVADKFLEEINKGSDEGNRLDHCRRIVSHHFIKILRMKKLKLIDDSFIKEVAPPIQAQFLFEVIEPLERSKNPKYDTSIFDMFRELYPELSKAGRIA